jgi:hypothetical protein
MTEIAKIIPKIINDMNYIYENRHKKKTQQIIFGENSVDSKVDDNSAIYENIADENVQLIDCDTSNMLTGLNASKMCAIMIIIENPSQDNKGHIIYILDSSGGCGSHIVDGAADITNEIRVAYYDETNALKFINEGRIMYEHETLTIFSDGITWKLYDSLLYNRIETLEISSSSHESQLYNINYSVNNFVSNTIIKNVSGTGSNAISEHMPLTSPNDFSNQILNGTQATFNCTWSCKLNENASTGQTASGRLYLLFDGDLSSQQIQEVGTYYFHLHAGTKNVSFSASFNYTFSAEESEAATISAYLVVDGRNIIADIVTNPEDHFNCNMQTIGPFSLNG